jgi:hypothetical protein
MGVCNTVSADEVVAESFIFVVLDVNIFVVLAASDNGVGKIFADAEEVFLLPFCSMSICFVSITAFFLGSFVVLDVITASICSGDNDDVCEIFVWESLEIDVVVVVVVVVVVLICGPILVLVSDLLAAAFDDAAIGDDSFWIVICAVLFAGAVMVDVVFRVDRICTVGLCFIDVLIV